MVKDDWLNFFNQIKQKIVSSEESLNSEELKKQLLTMKLGYSDRFGLEELRQALSDIYGDSITKDNIITLNSELLKKDISLIDYVIIHEMTHFFEQNHGKHFWELVSMAIPDYKEKRKKLKY